jgi:hypothetical protein
MGVFNLNRVEFMLKTLISHAQSRASSLEGWQKLTFSEEHGVTQSESVELAAKWTKPAVWFLVYLWRKYKGFNDRSLIHDILFEDFRDYGAKNLLNEHQSNDVEAAEYQLDEHGLLRGLLFNGLRDLLLQFGVLSGETKDKTRVLFRRWCRPLYSQIWPSARLLRDQHRWLTWARQTYIDPSDPDKSFIYGQEFPFGPTESVEYWDDQFGQMFDLRVASTQDFNSGCSSQDGDSDWNTFRKSKWSVRSIEFFE